jgi:hypothetical protein
MANKIEGILNSSTTIISSNQKAAIKLKEIKGKYLD